MMPAVRAPRPTVEERIRAAIWFAAQGFGVFSVWSTDGDGTCRCPKGRACENAGKHPIGRQGFLEHTWDPERIRILLSAGSEPNYGLVCPDGVFVLDVDGDGVARLVELEATLGPLPPTLRTNTAHGQHVFLRWPADHPRPIGQLFGYVTRWGSGNGAGYVIGPRSVHATGAVYAPASADVEIAILPETWVRAAIAKQPGDGAITVTGPRPASAIAVGHRHGYLRDRARHLRGVGLSGEALFAAVMDLNRQLGEPKTEDEVRRAIGDVESRFDPDPIDPATARTAALSAAELEDAPLTEFASEPVRWLWDAWLPRGVVTLMDGNPGVSKSTLVADLVARITTGRCWPDGSSGAGRPGRAMWITSADDPGRVLRPRIEAAGGEASLVRFVKGEVVFPSGAGPFTDLVVRRAAEAEGLALVILDPLFSHIDATVRTIADAEMRKGVMNPLNAAAEAAGVAILVVCHFSKDTTASAINRGAGSLGGIVGAARALWTVVPDPHDESGEAKVVGVSKLNYARVHKALRYRVVDRVPPGWVAGSVSGIEWLGEASSSIEAMLGAGPRSLEATRALEEILAEGRVDARAGEARMRARGFGASAIKGARAALGVKPKKSGMTGGWTWELPAAEEADGTDALEGAEDDGPTSSTSSASHALRVVPPAADVQVPCFFYRDHQFKHARIPGTDRFGCPICHPEEGPIA